jgi:hypothetical protein
MFIITITITTKILISNKMFIITTTTTKPLIPNKLGWDIKNVLSDAKI